MDCINKRSYIQVEFFLNITVILVNKPNLLGTHSNVYNTHNFPFYMTSQFHLFFRINIWRRKKNLSIKRWKWRMKTFHYMKMHCVARCPCLRLIIRWYHPGTSGLGGSFSRLGMPWEMDSSTLGANEKRVVIRGTSCKKLLTNIS